MANAVPYVDDLWSWILSLPRWQGFLLLVLATVLLAKAIQVGGDVLIRRVTRRIPTDVDDVIFETIHPPLYATVVLTGGYLAVLVLGMAPDVNAQVEALILSILAVMWALTLTRVGRKVSNELTENSHVNTQVVPIFQNVWSVIVVAVTIYLLLALWSIDPTPFLASAGIIGIVIGFAARDTIANFFGSIALYFDGTYKVGDYIVLETGERGRVEDISIRSTVIRTRDDMLVTVPNSVLNSARIINESTPDRERRVRIEIGVAYGSDTDEVEGTLLAVADEEALVIDRPKPRVRLRSFGDSALQYELLCWVNDPVLRGRATHKLNTGVYNALRAADIEIPFPQRVVTFSEGDRESPPTTDQFGEVDTE
ncbi:mechanosensitive ion channel family protein [Halapricum hydrolyticum]|uniref:Mechanosensitive ion channel family protein n=1 Tax=Halapricum hydrolyticum TaxID=2979991 RepID=A0AAE3LFC8_9EURY|nr:mechanosensitive ion channel family protein [Halapricum hydrolyticum]MCU4718494.1 mechanosensitive ion channel family protein [Halapricum hydrolyticum]MCU4727487.1 mechanosensitive ion channel family protein [Halapricum hydrolyticum]